MPLGDISGIPDEFKTPKEPSTGQRVTQPAPMPPFMDSMFRAQPPLPESVPMIPVELTFDANSTRDDIILIAQELLASIVDGATSGETLGVEFHQRCQALQLTMDFLAIKQ